MSSKTARNPPREQPGRGYNFQVTRASPPQREAGRTQPAVPAPRASETPQTAPLGTTPDEATRRQGRLPTPLSSLSRRSSPTTGSCPGPTPRQRPKPRPARPRRPLARQLRDPRGTAGAAADRPLGSARLPRCAAPFRPTRTLQSLSGAMAVPQPLLSLRPSDSALAESTQQKGSGQAALGAVSGAGVGRGRSSSQRGVAAGPPATLIAARCCRLSRSVCSVAPFGGARLPPPGAVSKADGVFFASCAMAEGAAGTGLRAERSGFRGHSLAVGTTQPAAAGRARCRTGAFPRPTALPWPRSFFSSSCSRFPSKPCEPPLRVCSRPPWWSPASGLTGAAPKGAAARGGSPARRMAP